MILQPLKTVRIDVLVQWLKGIPRDTIALSTGIGRGSVSRIIQYFRKGEIPDIDSIRELCVYWKKNNLDITQIADSIRLSNLLKQLGLTEGQIENFVEQVILIALYLWIAETLKTLFLRSTKFLK